MIWDLEDEEQQMTHDKMKQSFGDICDSSESDQHGHALYSIVIKNKVQWQLAIDYLAASVSFQQADRAMLSRKDGFGFRWKWKRASDRNVCLLCWRDKSAEVGRYLVESWTFSVTMDVSTHLSMSHLYIRIPLHSLNHGIINAFSLFNQHSSLVIFKTASKALDVLFSAWHDTILAILIDAKKKMTGQLSGVTIRFQQVVKSGFIRVWCGAHQLDIVLQKFYSAFGDEEFCKQLTGLISYLCRCRSWPTKWRQRVLPLVTLSRSACTGRATGSRRIELE